MVRFINLNPIEIASTMKPGDHLFHYREAHGLTQKGFARKIDACINYFSDLEIGQRAIIKAMAKMLAAKFNNCPAVFINK